SPTTGVRLIGPNDRNRRGPHEGEAVQVGAVAESADPDLGEAMARHRISMRPATESDWRRTNREGAAVPKVIPDCPPVPAVHAPGRLTHDYRIRLITPMFGGGIVPGEIDRTDPIRGTAIRGHLQFWWRATRGAGCATTGALIEKHAEVWGGPEKSSPIDV